MELRCPSRIKHGELVAGVLEVRCRSNRCGHEPGVVVLHRFDALTGELIETRKYNDPVRRDNAADARSSGSVPVAR